MAHQRVSAFCPATAVLRLRAGRAPPQRRPCPWQIRYRDINAHQVQFTVPVPMPKSAAVALRRPPASPGSSSQLFLPPPLPPAPQAGVASLFRHQAALAACQRIAGRAGAPASRWPANARSCNSESEQNLVAEQQRQSQDLCASSPEAAFPIQAVERLKEIGDQEGAIFTQRPHARGSWTPCAGEGLPRPLGMVTGSAMYHVGQAYASATGDCEVTVLSDAYNAATQLAVDRMRQELAHINGHGVVGVRLSLVRHECGRTKTIEVQVIGTRRGRPPARRQKTPWLCDLSGQEWYALPPRRLRPRRTRLGTRHLVYPDHPGRRMGMSASWSNVEMSHWSNALSKARPYSPEQSESTGRPPRRDRSRRSSRRAPLGRSPPHRRPKATSTSASTTTW